MHSTHLYEFFAGGGMARLGFGAAVTCLFANDVDPMKADAYGRNFVGTELLQRDITTLSTAQLPGQANAVWASSPCQDLSVAGRGAGLSGARSGLLFAFLWLMAGLAAEGRAPTVIAIENVPGLIRSNGGADLAAVLNVLASIGYRVGAVVINAAAFLPQARKRLFIIAVRDTAFIPAHLVASAPDRAWHPLSLDGVLERLSPGARAGWIWWSLPAPEAKVCSLQALLQPDSEVSWHSRAETNRLVSQMAPGHLAKLEAARKSGLLTVGAVSLRTRNDAFGKGVRAEVRFDGRVGCLVTPKGGSSLQRLLFVEGSHVRSRLMTPREAARLMGLPDRYELPERYRDAMRLIGDGVAVPVVEHLVRHLIRPILRANSARFRSAA